MKYKRGWIVAMILGMLIIAYIDRVALSISAKPISSEFGLSPVSMGFLFSAFSWTYILCIVPASLLVDRIGTKFVAGAGLLLWSAATVLTGLSWSFGSLIFARLLLGIGETISFPAAGRVIRDWFPERERGQVSTIFNSGSSAGTAIGAPLSAALIGLTDWRWTFIILGVFGIFGVCVWAYWFNTPERTTWLSAEERQTILRDRDPLQNNNGIELPEPHRLRDLLKHPTVWGLMLTEGGMVYTGYMFFSWMPSYLQSTLKLSMSKMGSFTAIPFIFAIIGAFICARVCDKMLTPETLRVGRRRIFITFFMLLGLTMLLAQYMHSAWSLLSIMALVTLSNNATTAFNLALANDMVDNPRDSSRVVGLSVLGGNAFGLLAPIVTGYVVSRTGAYHPAFEVAACFLVFGALSCLFLSRWRIAPTKEFSKASEISNAAISV